MVVPRCVPSSVGPGLLLARADTSLSAAAQAVLAVDPDPVVRLAWAARGDLDAALVAERLVREQDPAVWVALAAWPGSAWLEECGLALDPGAPAVDPWLLSALLLSPGAPEQLAWDCGRALLACSGESDPWLGVLTLLAPTLAGLPRYALLVALAARAGVAFPAVGGPPSAEVLEVLLPVVRVDPRRWPAVAALCYDDVSAACVAASVPSSDPWSSAVRRVLVDPVGGVLAWPQERSLPLALAVRASLPWRRGAVLADLVELVVASPSAARLAAPALALNDAVAPELVAEVASALDAGFLPPSCPARGPRVRPLPLAGEVAALSPAALSALGDFSVGAFLAAAACPGPWEVVRGLWAEWSGAAADLVAAALVLAE